MNVETIRLTDLKPLETNVRRHSEKQIDELMRSLKQFGQTRAIVVDEKNEILIGNGLYYALVKMGAETAQVFRKTGLTEIQKKKLVLSDNKIYALGSDDYDGINSFVNAITKAGDFDIAGFDTYTLEMLTMDDAEAEEDMRSYGTVTDETLSQTTEPVSRQPHYATEEEMSRYESAQSVSGGSNYTPNAQTPVAHPEAVRRSVVCPNCGEVIYID